jgi:hypothetical protein
VNSSHGIAIAYTFQKKGALGFTVPPKKKIFSQFFHFFFFRKKEQKKKTYSLFIEGSLPS